MIDLKRILVPTDFSRYSQNAQRYAVAFAEKFGAELHLLHVVQDLAVFIPDGNMAPPPATTPLEQLTAQGRAALEKAVAEGQLGNVRHRCEVRDGVASEEIVRYAREADTDLIVMGTHGHTGLMHLLMGSVAEKVVRTAPCPVLTVHDPEHEFIHP